MADLKLKIHPFMKGSKLEVTVEESINDILLVCLNYGSTIFRGVLMDIKKRNLPFGISFPAEPQKPDPGGKIHVNWGKNEGHEIENGAMCMSSTTQRHSYIKDPFEFTNKPFPLPSTSIIRRKTVRDIRLRPRKTLCTNCKANIHDTKVSHASISTTNNEKSCTKSTIMQSTRIHSQTTSPSMQLRKRQLSTDDESPSKSPVQYKVGRMNLSPRLMVPKTSCTKTKSYARPISIKKKSTPTIKISIGGDSVLNIPPRISENETTFKNELSEIERGLIKKELTVRLTDIADEANTYTALRKVKKSTKRAKERETEVLPPEANLTDENIKMEVIKCNNKTTVGVSSHTKKHKHKHKHERHRHTSAEDFHSKKKEIETNLCSVEKQGCNISSPNTDSGTEFYNEMSEEYEENIDTENNVPISDDKVQNRPRLVYTWKQNKGLSRIDTKFCGTKDYPLRSKDKETDKYLSPRNDGNVTSYSDGEDSSVTEISESEDTCISESQTSDSESFLSPDLSASPEKAMDTFKPLMMKIQTQNVNKCVTSDDRRVHVNDIVWGKIQGFPWWPGRIKSITITKKDNGLVIAQLAHIAWFGSSTRSHMPCDEIFPFLEDFKLRFNKKKRGPYKLAIRQATMAARRTTDTSDVVNSIELQNCEN